MIFRLLMIINVEKEQATGLADRARLSSPTLERLLHRERREAEAGRVS